MFYLKMFSFLEVKFSIYLNRRVFVMKRQACLQDKTAKAKKVKRKEIKIRVLMTIKLNVEYRLEMLSSLRYNIQHSALLSFLFSLQTKYSDTYSKFFFFPNTRIWAFFHLWREN